MRSIQSVVHNLELEQRYIEKPVQNIQITPQTAEVVNQAFKTLKALSPSWKAAFPTSDIEDEAKRAWTQAFAENGISDTRQLELGYKRRRDWPEPWFPSTGQFIEWCKPTPEDYGLPSAASAFNEASRHINSAFPHNWSHVAVLVAARAMGSLNFAEMSYSNAEKEFKRNYEIVVRRVMNGEDIEADIPKALPKSVHVVTDEEQAKRNAAGLKAMLRGAAS